MAALPGKTALVTGANTGLGKATALQLCQQGAHVIIACRSVDKANAVLPEFDGLDGTVEVLKLDLSDVASIEDFCKGLKRAHKKLDIVVCNAGLNLGGSYSGPRVTAQGYDIVMGTNYLGHLLLIDRLLPELRKSGDARIVMTSSATIWLASVKYHNYIEGPSRTNGNYAASKHAMATMGFYLHKRFLAHGDKIAVTCVDPGFVNSDIWRNTPLFATIANILALSPAKAAEAMVAAATEAKYDGLYLYPFNFKVSSWLARAPSATMSIVYPLLSKICFGLSVDKAEKRCYKEEVQTGLRDLTKERLTKHGFAIPLLDL
mmetsp:Transcript_2689/g.9768  ORF Transcript_2689/g.9768 Transcript_2689/m.9768 type:complete len:318 (+) Transcript_2689:64-1017(+)